MIIGVDIDQTIGTGYKGACFQESITYYQSKGLTIPQTVRGYPELFQLPAVLRIHAEGLAESSFFERLPLNRLWVSLLKRARCEKFSSFLICYALFRLSTIT